MCSLESRFWAKVEKTESCWLWRASVDHAGYGKIGSGGKYGRTLIATRVSLRLHGVEVPDHLDVCHRCDTPACVNPDHLFVGTCRDNMRDAVAKDRIPRGAEQWMAKLDEDDVRTILVCIEAGIPQWQIADYFDVAKSVVGNIKHGRTWSHVSR